MGTPTNPRPTRSQLSIAWLAGLWVAASGVLNLRLPTTRNCDATKILDSLERMLRDKLARTP